MRAHLGDDSSPGCAAAATREGSLAGSRSGTNSRACTPSSSANEPTDATCIHRGRRPRGSRAHSSAAWPALHGTAVPHSTARHGLAQCGHSRTTRRHAGAGFGYRQRVSLARPLGLRLEVGRGLRIGARRDARIPRLRVIRRIGFARERTRLGLLHNLAAGAARNARRRHARADPNARRCLRRPGRSASERVGRIAQPAQADWWARMRAGKGRRAEAALGRSPRPTARPGPSPRCRSAAVRRRRAPTPRRSRALRARRPRRAAAPAPSGSTITSCAARGSQARGRRNARRRRRRRRLRRRRGRRRRAWRAQPTPTAGPRARLRRRGSALSEWATARPTTLA
jgi:hypothetical protein